MKKKVIEHLANNAYFAVIEIERDLQSMIDNNRKIYCVPQTESVGLDISCLRESIEKAKVLVELLR